jgi:hypothetical protein
MEPLVSLSCLQTPATGLITELEKYISYQLYLFKKSLMLAGVHSASLVQVRSYLEENVAAPVSKGENTVVGIRHAEHVAPYIRKNWY